MFLRQRWCMLVFRWIGVSTIAASRYGTKRKSAWMWLPAAPASSRDRLVRRASPGTKVHRPAPTTESCLTCVLGRAKINRRLFTSQGVSIRETT